MLSAQQQQRWLMPKVYPPMRRVSGKDYECA
jgi:hypothetical protein